MHHFMLLPEHVHLSSKGTEGSTMLELNSGAIWLAQSNPVLLEMMDCKSNHGLHAGKTWVEPVGLYLFGPF